MDAYSSFAQVYDFLMKDVNYDSWVDYIEEVFEKKQIKPRNILELACGTGNVTLRLAERNYNITGIDLSSDMLTVAQKKLQNTGKKVRFINQDITKLEVNETFDCVICMCDGINYILEENDLGRLFNTVYKILNKDGVFIFDISSYYKISEILGNNTYAENYDDISYIWENYYDEISNICEFDLTIFVKKDELFERFQESHQQRAYKVKEIYQSLKNASFKDIEVFDDFTFDETHETSERINFICQK